ncbi:MAG TPA: hypothetical protein V6D19_03505 [Stenomitos sp.]
MKTLHDSWQRMWSGLGAKGDGTNLCASLMGRYAEPHRKYHTLQHLQACITWFEKTAHLALHSAEVEAALWFHDAIYDLERHDNEAQSAEWARVELTAVGVNESAILRVAQLVLATKHTVLPGLPDEKLVVDIDLAILGAPQHQFAEYERQIREEYAFVPEVIFLQKRCEILQSFLAREFIYTTELLHTLLEARARHNLFDAVQAIHCIVMKS